MKIKQYGVSISLPEQVTDITPEYRLIPGDVSVHCHDFYEIEVVVSGTGTQILNGQNCQLRRGSVTVLAPSDFHAVMPQENLYVYNFMFRGALLSKENLNNIWSDGSNRFLHFEEEELQEILSICQILTLEHEKQSQERPVIMKNLMECFLIILTRAMRQHPRAHKVKNKDAIQACIQYLHKYYLESPSIPKAAAAVGLSPNYLAHRFREITGQTYTEYLTKLKLSHARRLLLTSTISVTDACFASGFTSISNFTKVFKKYTGVSARQFAQLHSQTDAG